MDVKKLIANNLKTIRDEKKLSLDNAAKITGVSKSMLGQIERGAVNPTISVLWKIANGLKISFVSLIEVSLRDTEVIKYGETVCLTQDDDKYSSRLIFPFDDARRFEIYYIEIEPGGTLDAEAHLSGTEEFITVFNGSLTIAVNGAMYKLCKGDSIHFKSDTAHSYYNDSTAAAELSMVIYSAK